MTQSDDWKVILTKQAFKHLQYWQTAEKGIYQKALEILELLKTQPLDLNTIGKPEWLKGNLAGCMSRRITQADRCVYRVYREEKIIQVLQLRFHYDDH